jgi:hypothetical protein
MGILKKLARGLKKSAPMGAAAMVAKTVEPAIQKAQASAPAAPPKAPPGAEMGPARRGFFGKVQQAIRKAGPAIKEAAPAMKKNFEANPAKAVAGGVRGIARGIGRGMGRMGFKDGGSVSSGRGDGAAIRGKTKCKMY